MGNGVDEESQAVAKSSLSHWRLIVDQGVTTPEIEEWHYNGSGTEDDPFAVTWIENDPRNPMTWSPVYKWMVTLCMAFATLAVSLCSSAFSGGIPGLIEDYRISDEVATLGLSLFVLGFAIGPLLWAPLSELYGRQLLYFGTFACFAFFNAGVAAAQNSWSVIILRFFAGSFGSSPLTNAGGVVADCFAARQRGLAMSIFATAPFLGPALGPVIGGFMGQTVGWRWVMGFLAIFSGFCWLIGVAMTPETYAPVLMRKRAQRLSKKTGKVYKSKFDIDRGQLSFAEAFKTSLSRPWILLFREPIVFILSIYMAIVYGTLYMLFAAYPIVYQDYRHWSQGIGGLAFIGVLIGMLFAVLYSIFVENKRYQKAVDKASGGFAPPEARLPASMVGGCFLPVGLFWFSWTNAPNLPWQASVAAGIPFGFGMVLVFLSIMNYLIDAYTIFAASVLAANSVLRSCFGAAFPLFTTYMYNSLGIHWASSIPAFLALACVPFPFLFYKYGPSIRVRCKYAAEADAFMKRLRAQQDSGDDTSAASEKEIDDESPADKQDAEGMASLESAATARPTPDNGGESGNHFGMEAVDESLNRIRYEKVRTNYGSTRPYSNYEEGPFNIDRVNTRESFRSEQVQLHGSQLKLSKSHSGRRLPRSREERTWT